ncbi:MAG: 3-oxoacyl-ACP synthase III [Opitutales bacterium]
MRFEHVRLVAAGTVLPPRRVTSEEIEQRLAPLYERLRLPLGRLELMTGIRERRFWDGPQKPSVASAEAGRKALEAWGGDPASIELLAHCGVCRDRLEPATAAYVHGLLGLAPGCQVFDVSNACLGFLNALALAGGLIESGQIRRALLVSGEDGWPLLERTLRTLLTRDLTRKTIKPYFANLTIGAGAVAWIVTHADDAPADALRLVGGTVETDSSANELCQGDSTPGSELEMLTEAEALLEAGLGVAARNWERFTAQLGWDVASLAQTICHQVGRSHQRQLLARLGLDPARDFTTYETLGNIGSVSLPLTLVQAIEAGALGPGERAALLGIGSGLSSIMMGVER